MPRKSHRKLTEPEKPLPAVAFMKFWSRLKHPRPMLAMTFPESDDNEPESLGVLSRLPDVPADDSTAFVLKISLDTSKPPVWRRVLTKGFNLENLHHLIQLAMGWDDCHLHGFEIRKTRVPSVEDGAEFDERTISISQLYAAKIKNFAYVYDFGDHWKHTITIEKSCSVDPQSKYPQCVGGRGTCPLEDIGGTSRWNELLAKLQHPDTDVPENRADLNVRLGENYKPVPFDIEAANARVLRAFNKSVRRKGHA